MSNSSHGAQLCRFWVTEKQILPAAGSTGYNSVADVVVGAQPGFFLSVKLLCVLNPSNTWKEQSQQVPVEGMEGQELLPGFPTGIFSLLSQQESFSPLLSGVGFPGAVFWSQLGVLLVVVGDLQLQPNPVIAQPQHSWGRSPAGNNPKNPMELIPRLVWASTSACLIF